MTPDNSAPMAALPEPAKVIESRMGVRYRLFTASQMHEHAAKVTADLRERVEALEADAARYRLLKSRAWVEDRDSGMSGLYRFPFIPAFDNWVKGFEFNHGSLDEAIDAYFASLGVDTAIAAEERT